MIIFLQFPIIDIRQFLPDDTGALAKPIWPSPEPYSQFVRSFGVVKPRGKGGVIGWVGENAICDAHNALRLYLHIPPFEYSQGKIHLKCIAKHFFFSGQVIGKYELVFITAPISVNLNEDDFTKLIHYIFQIQASIHFPGKLVTKDLYSIRNDFAKFYLYASTDTHKYNGFAGKNWIIVGEPLLFCELSKDEKIQWKHKPIQCNLSTKCGLIFSQQWMLKDNKRIQVLTVNHQDSSEATRQKGRLLRIYLMRLYAEYEGVRKITSLIRSKEIAPQRSTPESEALQSYLNGTEKKISNSVKKMKTCSEDSLLSDLVLTTCDRINPGERDSLIQLLKQYDFRPQVINNTEMMIGIQKEIREIKKEINMAKYKTQNWEKMVVYIMAFLVVLLVGYLLIRNEPFADPNLVVIMRIILSVFMAVIGGTIPGFLKVDFSTKGKVIRASGALALFVIAFLLTPTVLD